MKKKFIIAAIIGVVIIGGTTAVVALNNREATKVQKEEYVNNEEAFKEVVKDEEENTNSDENLEEKDDNESKPENLDNTSENDNSESQSTINKKAKEQTIDEGYNIFYKARDAYEREDFDEAIRLYETITNRDALAKVVLEKDRFYFAKSVNDQIDEGQKLYDSGEYIQAKIFMSKLMRGNYMMPKQEARANQIYENAKSKVTPEEEKNAQQNFTYEKALEVLKREIGDNPNKSYEYSQEYIDEINGGKTIYIMVTRQSDNYSELYLVGSDGSVITGS